MSKIHLHSMRVVTTAGIAFSVLTVLSAQAEPLKVCGKASWYNLTGMTASGERADPTRLTAAHKTLPFGTLVDVTNLANGKTVTVRINDRGPFTKGRIIDVTEAAAEQLEFINQGVTSVRISGKFAEKRENNVRICG